MADYAYVIVPKKLQDFMKHIQNAGIPTKITRDYLKGAGFKSSNDQPIVSVLKFLGFLDSSGVPTEVYARYRNKAEAPTVLGTAIIRAYDDLFKMYPDAYQKDVQTLRNFFASHTTRGQKVLSAMVSTFQALCSLARFEALAVQPTQQAAPGVPQPPAPTAKALEFQTLAINIQLALPETTNSKVYEEIFKAMKKHLLEGPE